MAICTAFCINMFKAVQAIRYFTWRLRISPKLIFTRTNHNRPMSCLYNRKIFKAESYNARIKNVVNIDKAYILFLDIVFDKLKYDLNVFSFSYFLFLKLCNMKFSLRFINPYPVRFIII